MTPLDVCLSCIQWAVFSVICLLMKCPYWCETHPHPDAHRRQVLEKNTSSGTYDKLFCLLHFVWESTLQLNHFKSTYAMLLTIPYYYANNSVCLETLKNKKHKAISHYPTGGGSLSDSKEGGKWKKKNDYKNKKSKWFSSSWKHTYEHLWVLVVFFKGKKKSKWKVFVSSLPSWFYLGF